MSRLGKDHFMRKFTVKMPRPQSEHPDQAPAFTTTVRTLQGWHIVWGKIKEQDQ